MNCFVCKTAHNVHEYLCHLELQGKKKHFGSLAEGFCICDGCILKIESDNELFFDVVHSIEFVKVVK